MTTVNQLNSEPDSTYKPSHKYLSNKIWTFIYIYICMYIYTLQKRKSKKLLI